MRKRNAYNYTNTGISNRLDWEPTSVLTPGKDNNTFKLSYVSASNAFSEDFLLNENTVFNKSELKISFNLNKPPIDPENVYVWIMEMEFLMDLTELTIQILILK
jgi:hypothetical protein